MDVDEEDVEELKERMAEGLADKFGFDPEEVEDSSTIDNWAKGYKDFTKNPIEHYEESIEHSKQLIEKYEKRIKIHEMKINRLKTLIENEKIDQEE